MSDYIKVLSYLNNSPYISFNSPYISLEDNITDVYLDTLDQERVPELLVDIFDKNSDNDYIIEQLLRAISRRKYSKKYHWIIERVIYSNSKYIMEATLSVLEAWNNEEALEYLERIIPSSESTTQGFAQEIINNIKEEFNQKAKEKVICLFNSFLNIYHNSYEKVLYCPELSTIKDSYFENLEELQEYIGDGELPLVCYPCVKNTTFPQYPHDVLPKILAECCLDLDKVKGIKELAEALEVFKEANKDLVTYTPNYKYPFLLKRK